MKKRKSIQVRFTLLFVCVMLAINIICYLLINNHLEDYYFHRKCNTMREVYQTFLELTDDNLTLEGEEDTEIIINGQNYQISLESIAGENAKKLKRYSRAILEVERETGISCIIQITRDKCLSSYEVNSGWMMNRLLNLRMQYRLADTAEEIEGVIEATSMYCLQYNKEKMNDTDYLDMWGRLSDGVWFLMSMPVERVHESVAVSSRFYLYLGLIGTCIGALLMFFIMQRATKPIRSLMDISERMSTLDFNAKYTGKTEEEIGILGKNLNEMSQRLEQTMTELRNANLEMKNDIEKKTQLETQRTEFISNVSHELKTPIALIQGYAEGLAEGVSDDPESRKYYCEVIVDEAQKMNRLVRQLLSLNQLEAGEQQLEVGRFDIIELLRGAVNSQDILMHQNDTYIVLKPHDPIFVWGDEYKIEEVVMNYLSNAWNHLGGKKQIIIDAVEKDGKVRVSVFNTGKQIPEDEIDRIWEKFYKVDKARTREYGGHGIGLSIVKAIMERHDGACGAYNTEDGVVFWFEL